MMIVPMKLSGLEGGPNAGFCVLLLICGLLFTTVPGCRKAPKITATPPTAAAGRTEPHIRVLLRSGFRRYEVIGEQRADRLFVEVTPGSVTLSAPRGNATEVIGHGTGFRLIPQRKWLYLDQTAYRGALDIFINPLGEAVVVNDLSLEDYLRSVVPGELGPQKYPDLEALKAQCVAARTFAISALGQNADRGFDVYNDNRSQVYRGVMSEQKLSDRAVGETRGMVATYQGKPILSMYCSTCGGVTEGFAAVFKGDPIAYLNGGARCRDEESPYHEWDEWIDLRERAAVLDRYAGVGRLKDLETLLVSENGRVVTMRFTGERGQKVLRGNDVRFALGLRSNWILSMKVQKDHEGFIEKLHVRGRGWGHGVGLCQIGAVELAQRGKSFMEILKHYYSGIDITPWYAARGGKSQVPRDQPPKTSE